MSVILHLDSSISKSESVTRLLSAEIVRQLQARDSLAHLHYRDLTEDAIPHLTGPIAQGFRPLGVNDADEETQSQHRLSDALVSEFLASDIMVIGAPMYNFSVPSQLKAWLDRLAQPGKTFRYTEKGPVGLAGGRTVIVASARGGFYENGPFTSMDFQERYLSAYFGFLGIEKIHFIRAEGASKSDDIRQHEIERALNAISDVVAAVN